MKCIIVGASSGLGRALATAFAAAGHDLLLVASDERDLAAVAADVAVRYGVGAEILPVDVAETACYVERLAAAAEPVGQVRAVLFPVGAVAEADAGALATPAAERLVRVNLLSVIASVARLLPELRAQAEPTSIVGFGSVAAARGRGANAVYAACKRGLESYFESLRHACVGTKVTVQFYIPGYLDTNLSFDKRLLLRRADPAVLSAQVLRDLHRDIGVVYFPRFWRAVCSTVRWLPWFVYRRLNF